MGEKRAGLVFSADLCTSDKRWGRRVYICLCRDMMVRTEGFSVPVGTQHLNRWDHSRCFSAQSPSETLKLYCCDCLFTFQVSTQAIMEAAICTLITQFKQYAGKDGSSSTLSKDEFHSLVTTQLPNYVQVHPQHVQTLKNLWLVIIGVQTYYSCMYILHSVTDTFDFFDLNPILHIYW